MKSKYNSLTEWRKADTKGYSSAKKANILVNICEKFNWPLPKEIFKIKSNGYWQIKENVLSDALNYKTTTEWNKMNTTAYSAARKNGWFEEATAHMLILIKPKGYWNEETIFEESKKYKTPQDWKKGSSSSYTMSFKIEGLYEKCIVEMGFDRPRKVGFWQIKENVLAKAREYKTRSEWGTGPNSHGASYDSAKKNGWFEEATAHMIEINKPTGYWTKEVILETAKKYKYYSDWVKNEKAAYQAALKQKLIDECTSHMIFSNVRNGHWNIKENVLAEALKYKTRSEFSRNSAGAYNSAKQNGWYDECIAHMDYAEGHTPANFWTKEKVLSIAKKYDNRLDWVKNNKKSVDAARRNGWMEKAISHMNLSIKPFGYWEVKENVLAEALKHKTKKQWQKKSNGSMKSARKNGWYEEATAHMIKSKNYKPKGYWTKELCQIEALKYNDKSEWYKNHLTSYNAAYKYGWLDECSTHFVQKNNQKGYWNVKKHVLEEALKYKTRSEWVKASSSSYNSAKKNGWFEEASAHMGYAVKPNGYWTKELLLAEAKKWGTLKEWRELGEGYSRAKPLGCYDECIAHMMFENKPSGYWNIKENVLAEALKYSSKSEWQEKSNGSKKAAKQNGWYEEATAHMIKK